MWEELYIRRYASKDTSEAGGREASFAVVSHVEYKSALESLYKEILRFQVSGYCYYAHNAASRISRDVVRWDDWDTLLEGVRERERVFSAIRESWRDMKFDEECAAADRRHRESLLRWDAVGADLAGLRGAVEEAQRERKRADLLDWLCDVDPSAMYNAARDHHEAGTGDWLIKDNEQFQQWEGQAGSLLWLHGKGMLALFLLLSPPLSLFFSSFYSLLPLPSNLATFCLCCVLILSYPLQQKKLAVPVLTGFCSGQWEIYPGIHRGQTSEGQACVRPQNCTGLLLLQLQ